MNIACIILTKNEELHLERCIRSVKAVCDEVWVVDSFSTDGTQRIAEREGVNFVQHEYEYQARQFNWAIDNLPIRAEWIWRVDADEIIEQNLVSIAQRELPRLPESVTGVYVNKKIVFMGRPLMHGGWYPAPQIKLVRRGHGRSEDKLMDEHLIVTDGETVSWDGDQTDWNLQNLDWWWQKHIGYAKREARMQVKTPSIPLEGEECRVSSAESRVKSEDRRDASVEGKLFGTDAEWKRYMKNLYAHCPRYVRAVVYFLSRYVLMGGFLDGYAGWYWHTRQGLMYRWMVDREIGKLKATIHN